MVGRTVFYRMYGHEKQDVKHMKKEHQNQEQEIISLDRGQEEFSTAHWP